MTESNPDTDRSCGLVEAVWLIALAMVPVFFNPYSQRCFEPEKAVLVFISAVLMGCGLLWRKATVEWSKQAIRSPVVLAAGVVALSMAGSSLLAVAPRIAFLGSYDRTQGFAMTAAWLVMLAALFTCARHPHQIERILRVVVFSCVPVCGYALMQHFGIDPVTWTDNVAERCASTMGNPVFLGAYLVMLLPVTFCQILRAWKDTSRNSRKTGVLYGSVLILQGVTLWATGSRGPLVGGAVGMLVFVLLVLLVSGRRRVVLAFLAGGLLFAVLLIGQQTLRPASDTPHDSLRHLLARILPSREVTSRVRIVTWRAMTDLVLPHAPLTYPDGTVDRFNAVRPLVGYGPECLACVFDPFYPAELGRLEDKTALPDRAHNETWDVLATNGLIGLVAVWILYLAIFHCSLKQLGLVRHRQDAIICAVCCLGGALAGICFSTMRYGVALAGLGLPFGMLGGFLLYLGVQASRIGQTPNPLPAGSASLIGIALLSGIVAHIAEIQFGFPTIVTRTLFWTYTALILAIGLPGSIGLHSSPAPVRRSLCAGVALLIVAATLIGFVAVRPLYANILFARGLRLQRGHNSQKAIEWIEKAARLAPEEETYHSALGKHRLAQAIASGAGDAPMTQAAHDLLKAQALNPLRSENAVNLGGLYTSWAALSANPADRRERGRLADSCYAQAIRISPNRVAPWHERAVLSMNVLQAPDLAERYLQRALALDENHPRTHELMGEYYGRFGYSVTNNQDRVHYLNLALTHYERAVDLAKERHRTPPSFGLYVRMALLCRDLKSLDDEGIWELQPESNSAGAGEQGGYHRLSYGTDIVTYAAEALRLALGAETNHVKTLIESLVRSEDSFNLGRLYLGWAMFSTNSVDRRARESRAESCLAQAIRLSPSRMGPWHERALFQLRVLRDPEAAEGRVQQARATDENCPWVHDVLGDHYMRLASNTTDKRDRVHYDNLALRHYEWTVDFAKGGYRSPPSFDLYFRMALLCRELKNMDDEGIWELQLEPRGGDAGTKSGYRRSTFGAYATAYAAEALRLAPDSEKDNIRALIESSGILWER